MKRPARLRDSLAAAYDWIYSRANRLRFEHWVLRLSVGGFLCHLALIFFSRSLSAHAWLSGALPHPQALVAAVGTNYLAAIYTPFSLILFYEVLALVAAIPYSTVQSVASQFEIVSLIFVRGFFKDVAATGDIGALRQPSAAMLPAVTDACAGLLMFLLVTVFRHISLWRRRADATKVQNDELRVFIARKKGVALGLTAWLLVVAVYSFVDFVHETTQMMAQAAMPDGEPTTLFYTEVFSVMIFTDVLILILSLAVSDRYELVLRNAAFVISIILIRFSLTADRPYGAVLALLGLAFGIVTLLIYRYNSSLESAYSGGREPGW